MKIVIGESTYTKIKNISFVPETDITGLQLPINQLSVDIITRESIVSPGKMVKLYDDNDNLWCNYWITFAERMDVETFRVEASSRLIRLDRKKLGAHMYSGDSAAGVISSIFSGSGAGAYTLDSSFSNKTITGFCPEQTARERLQWVCFCIGAYVKDFFSDKIQILPIPQQSKSIPAEKTYWKPSTTYGDYVTGVKAIAYTYTQGTPQTTDKWVQVGNTTYIQTEQEFTLSNPDVPVTAEENIVTVDGLTLITPSNVDDILSHLSTYYFKRIEVDSDIINNAEYYPGDRVATYTGLETLIDGYIKSADFSFGAQSKSKLKIMQMDTIDGAKLIVKYMYDGKQIGKRTYYFPVGYQYEIENPYKDITKNKRRRVYRPLNDSISGTMPNETTTVTQQYHIALEFHKKVLKVLSVDSVEMQTIGDYNVVVIR